MSATRQRSITVVKTSTNQLNQSIMEDQLAQLSNKAIGKTFKGFGWECQPPRIDHTSDTSGHRYSVTLTFSKAQIRERDNSEEVFDTQFGDIVRKLISGGRALGWRAAEEQRNPKTLATIEAAEPKQEFTLNLPSNFQSYFSHIFERDAQIRIVYAAIQSAKASQFKKRNHCLLWGLPACGKTEILLSFEKMLGSDNVCKLDATATSKAGAENLLLEMDAVPPVLIIEEMEKTNPANLPWLLGVLDQRGEIIKTNARIGSVRREARCLCLATVNDYSLFQSIMSGALASRFAHKLYCPRPNRHVLEKILLREIKELGGKKDWIAPALQYCLDVEGTNDPRRAIAVLDGRDRLLSGEYQKDLLEIFEAQKRDQAEIEKMGQKVQPG